MRRTVLNHRAKSQTPLRGLDGGWRGFSMRVGRTGASHWAYVAALQRCEVQGMVGWTTVGEAVDAWGGQEGFPVLAVQPAARNRARQAFAFSRELSSRRAFFLTSALIGIQ